MQKKPYREAKNHSSQKFVQSTAQTSPFLCSGLHKKFNYLKISNLKTNQNPTAADKYAPCIATL